MDYLKYSGGIYSSEWFWAKIMKISRGNPRVRESAATWIEHCDWIPAVLAGIDDVDAIPRGRCAWGHKAMWHASWGGLPPADFLEYLDPYLGRVRAASPSDTWTAEKKVGDLCPEWARRLGLPRNVVIGGGAFDCHMGAVGAGIKPGWLVKVIGTSTCDIMIAPRDRIGDRQVRGICGQVDGSVVPGWIGLEAGQSAFGDLYAWFKDILLWPARNLGPAGAALESMEEKIMPALVEAAAAAPLSADGPIAVDWINGRRTPDANQGLKGALMGLAIGHDAPRLFRAVIEASAFGAKAIADRIREEGVPIEGILAIGGVARKAPFAMQVLADVMDSPIQVAASDQACALGASIFAAVAGGAYPDVPAAQAKMATSAERSYHPDKERAEVYRVLFRRYEAAGAFIESSAKEEGA